MKEKEFLKYLLEKNEIDQEQQKKFLALLEHFLALEVLQTESKISSKPNLISEESLLKELESSVDTNSTTQFIEKQETDKNPTLEFQFANSSQKTPLATQSSAASFPQIQERYKVLKKLGEGGMGVVELVQDQLLKREVALKKVKISSTHSSQKALLYKMLWRLKQEAFITAILQHPNIVPLYDFQQKGTEEFQFTMKKVEGKTLKEILSDKKEGQNNISENQLLVIFLKICDAISYAHSKKIIHRDLKPENIMVGEFGEVYVMDWGIAKQLEPPAPLVLDKELDEMLPNFIHSTDKILEESQETELCATQLENEEIYQTVGGIGTTGYMSPEQSENAAQVTLKADVFSLGKILKQLFTYLSPWEELKYQMSIIESALHSKNNDLKKVTSQEIRNQLEKKIPSEILAIVNKATKESPEERYETVKKLAKDVESYINGVRISVKEYSLLELFRMWSQRNKNIVLTISSTIALIFILAFTGFWFYKQYLLKTNLARLDYWFEELKNENPYTKEQAFYEISRMTEPEISSALMEKVKLGTLHFIDENRNRDLDNYYSVLAEILGLQKKQKMSLKIMQQLKILEKEMLKYEKGQRPFNTIEYMLTLVDALETSKAKGVYHLIDDIRHHLGVDSLFGSRSEQAYKRLGSLEDLGDSPLKNDELYYKRGHFKYHLKNYQGALTDLNQAILMKPTKALYYFNRANIYSELNKNQEALKDYNQTIHLNPQYISAFFNRSLIYSNQKNYQKAIEDLDQTIQMNPKDADIYNARGAINNKLKKYSKAIQDFDQAIKLDPQNAFFYYNRGKIKLKLNHYEQAHIDFNRAISYNPKIADFYYQRGIVHSLSKDPNRAILDFEHAIKLDNKSVNYYCARGRTRLINRNIKEAFYDFSQAIKLEPNNYLPFYDRAIALTLLKKHKEALEDFNQAAKLSPKNYKIFEKRAFARINLKDNKGALADFDKAISINQENSKLYFFRGNLKFIQLDFKGALKDYDQAIRLEPGNAFAFQKRGIAKGALGNLKDALNDLDKAIQLDSNGVEHFLERGSIFYQINEIQKAIQDFNAAIQLAPTNSRGFHLRAKSRAFLKEYNKAVQDFSKEIQLNPKSAEGYSGRGEMLLAMKNLPAALKDFEEAIKLNPNEVFFYVNRANTKFYLKDFEGAIKDHSKAIQMEPKNHLNYFRRGNVWGYINKNEKAAKDFEMVQKLKPEWSDNYLNLGYAYYSLNKIDKAIAVFKDGLDQEKNPKLQEVLTKLLLQKAANLYNKREYKKTLTCLLDFQKFAPENHMDAARVKKMILQLKKQLNLK